MGRKSLDAQAGGTSPQVGVRLAAGDHTRLTGLAAQRGLSVSEVIRGLVRAELARAGTGPPAAA